MEIAGIDAAAFLLEALDLVFAPDGEVGGTGLLGLKTAQARFGGEALAAVVYSQGLRINDHIQGCLRGTRVQADRTTGSLPR